MVEKYQEGCSARRPPPAAGATQILTVLQQNKSAGHCTFSGVPQVPGTGGHSARKHLPLQTPQQCNCAAPHIKSVHQVWLLCSMLS